MQGWIEIAYGAEPHILSTLVVASYAPVGLCRFDTANATTVLPHYSERQLATQEVSPIMGLPCQR